MIGKTYKLIFATTALTAVVMPSTAHAIGVPAGSSITNTASATYNTNGGSTVSVDSNEVVITVDELLDVSVTSQDGAPVPLGMDEAVLTYQITNNGNGPEAFNVTADSALTGNDFNATINNIAYDANGDGIYQPGTDPIIPSGSATPLINADDSLNIFVIVESPGGESDGDTGDVNLEAEAVTGTGPAGTIFSGQGENGSDAVVGVSGADDDDTGTLIASVATVTLTKSAAITDPFGGSEALPGATVTYTIAANVAGSGSISGLTITDPYPAGTSYVASTLTLDGAGLTDADDTDDGEADGTGVTVAIPTANGGTTYQVTFQVSID